MVSSVDREKMSRLALLLRDFESDEEPTPEALASAIAHANDFRDRHGIAPLRTTSDEDPPELGLYRRARSLGLGRHRG